MTKLVFESPVRFGLFAYFGWTGTETGSHLTQNRKRPDRTAEDRSFAVFLRSFSVFGPVFGLFGLNRFKTGLFKYYETATLLPYFVALI